MSLIFLCSRKKPEFEDSAEEEIYEFCTELYETKRVSESIYERIVKRHGTKTAVDLAGLLGHYNLIAITLNVFDECDLTTPLSGELGF